MEKKEQTRFMLAARALMRGTKIQKKKNKLFSFEHTEHGSEREYRGSSIRA